MKCCNKWDCGRFCGVVEDSYWIPVNIYICDCCHCWLLTCLCRRRFSRSAIYAGYWVFLENCDVDVVCMHSAVSSLSHSVWLWNAFYWPWGNLIAADVMPCVCFRPADVPHSYHHYYSNPSYHTLSQNRPPLPHLPNNHDRTIKVNVISDI